MGLKRTVEPINLPVELSDARKQCEIGETDDSHDSHCCGFLGPQPETLSG